MNDLDVLERQLGPGLRRTLDAVIDPDRGAHRSGGVPGRRDARPRRRIVGVVTAAALAAGIAGTTIVLANRSPDGSSPAETPDSQPAPLDTLAGGPAPGTAADDDALPPASTSDEVAGIYLPALPIDGFTLSDISVERPAAAQAGRTIDRYLRTAAGGATAMLVVSAQPASQETIDDDSGSITVHGVPAHIYDSGAGVVVQWTQAGTTISLRGIGIGWNEMAAYAEASALAADGSVSVAALETDGFTLESSATPPPENAATTLVELLPDDNTAGLFVSVALRPNDELLTIDTVEAEQQANPTMQAERITVNGTPALLQTSAADQLGTMTAVRWFRDGTHISITSRLPREEILAIAESISPATLADAQVLADGVQARLSAIPEIDRATLPNGFEVSIHTTGTGANAICMHHPVNHCEPVTSESSLLGEQQSQAVVPIVVDDITWQVGWAEGVHQPVWADGVHDAGPLTDSAQGAAGTFVAFTSTSESAGVRFDAGEDPIYPAADPMIGTHQSLDLLLPSPPSPPPATTS